MSGAMAAFGTRFLALLPALLAVYAGCVLFVLVLALLGCRILSKTDRS
ncbi:MAG: hypothetical protein J5633_08830 [Oscillospiraceae bacterium]|nr:hypothetical protein [Oscillospiraceae bacterium]